VLERVRDLYDFSHAWRGAQCFDLRAAPAAADGPDDGALRTLDYVCLETTFLDSVDDVVDFVGGCGG
jgi:hypothetical protein